MTKTTHRITGFVLAGGKSSRMGQDKGLLQLQGKSLVEHVLEALKGQVQEVFIVANHPSYQQFGFPVIGDLVPEAGPMGGLLTALTASSTELNFIVSCDMPFITADEAKFMLNQPLAATVTVPSVADRMQPLFGIYHQRCLPTLAAHVKAGNLRMQEFIRQSDHQIVNLDGFAEKNPLIFQNLNTPQDYEEAVKQHKLWISR